ncbi:MAG: PAS domain S-box protein [Bacteroidetes bacterium]|nr:PAS domain S-box protein [Bacteroidota bacterium]
MHNALLIVDPETNTILDGNQFAKDLFGTPGKDLIGSKCKSAVCDINTDCISEKNHPGKLYPCEDVIRNKGKDLHMMRSCYETVLQGKKYIIVSIYDMHPLRDAEMEIELQKKHLESIYENSTVGIILLDMNGRFFQVNKAYCEMLYYSEEELLSGKVTVTHRDDIEASDQMLARLRSGETARNIMEKRYIRKDGQVIFALHNTAIIRDHAGEPLYFLIQTQDITHLKTALLKAMESDQLKTHFLQNLSHEVRTPANAIFGFYELLKSTALTDSERDEYMHYILGGVEQFMKIMVNIVDISKIEAGQFDVDRSAFNVNALLLDLHREYLRKHETLCSSGVDFTVFFPGGSTDIQLESDLVRVNQILINLLDNAFKFTTFGHITLGYHVLPDIEIIFFVKDSGSGIPKDKLDLVFQKFRQGDESGNRKYGGLGLGLTLSKEIASLLGGRLWLTSEEGKGTSVFLALPYNGNTGMANTAEMKMQVYDIPDLSGITILVAEDVDNNFFVLDRFLLKTNAKIMRARNGLEAIDICRKEKQIDLILMDIQMPIINGYDAAREILKIKPGIPIIAQTAYSVDFDKQNAIEAGCIAYMVKPLNMQEVFSTILKHVTLPDKG